MSKRRPMVFLFLLLAILGGCWVILESSAFGREILSVVVALFSSEAGAIRLHGEGKPIGDAFVWLLVIDAVNIFIDLVIINVLLSIQWSRALLDAISRRGKIVLAKITRFFKKDARINASQSHLRQNGILSRFDDIRKNPSKAGLGTVYVLATMPRIPPMPGGVSVAILVIRYNGFGIRGWSVLFAGIMTRHAYVLLPLYGMFGS